MAEVILPPSKGSLPHYHPEMEEVYYLLRKLCPGLDAGL
jgi:oxalate decarboxylase/phosphoglucose isomerase-like protein (cupin superfamily)